MDDVAVTRWEHTERTPTWQIAMEQARKDAARYGIRHRVYAYRNLAGKWAYSWRLIDHPRPS